MLKNISLNKFLIQNFENFEKSAFLKSFLFTSF